jgi:hypothetical protein
MPRTDNDDRDPLVFPYSPMYLMEIFSVINIYATVHDLHFKELDTFQVCFNIASMVSGMLVSVYVGMSSIVVYPLLVWISLN